MTRCIPIIQQYIVEKYIKIIIPVYLPAVCLVKHWLLGVDITAVYHHHCTPLYN